MRKPFVVLLEITFKDGSTAQTIVDIITAIEVDRTKEENAIKELVYYYAHPKT